MPQGVATGAKIPEATQLGVLAMLDMGYTLPVIAKKSGINSKTITAIKKNPGIRAKFRNSSALEDTKKRLLNRFFREANRSLDNIDQDKLDKASAYQLAGMSALFASKGLEMENQGKGHTLNFTVLLGSSYQQDPHGKVIDVTPGKVEK